jgi:hypothetical protein
VNNKWLRIQAKRNVLFAWATKWIACCIVVDTCACVSRWVFRVLKILPHHLKCAKNTMDKTGSCPICRQIIMDVIRCYSA